MKTFRGILLGLLMSVGIAGVAHAVPTIYFGEDLGLGEGTRLVSHPNADAARNSFLSQLVGVGTETFEGFATGTGAPLNIAFPGAGTATINGTGLVATVVSGTNGFGRYPISGDNYWEASGAFSIAFSNPIAAFGFYGVDIGDFNGQVTLLLSNGLSTLLTVPNSTSISGGSVLYYGFIETDPNALVTGITFGNTASGTDFFAFDDMTIGSLEQVNPVVPEPSTFLLLGAGLAGLGYLRRRSTKG